MAAAAAGSAEQIEQEATKLAKLKIQSSQNEKNLATAEKLNKKFMRALEEAQTQPNVTQIAVTAMSAVGVGFGGYAYNQKMRAVLAEKGWFNDKGERSFGAVAVTDGAPVLLGLAIMIGGAYIENGPLSAGVMGGGAGLAGGSLISTLNSPKLLGPVVPPVKI